MAWLRGRLVKFRVWLFCLRYAAKIAFDPTMRVWIENQLYLDQAILRGLLREGPQLRGGLYWAWGADQSLGDVDYRRGEEW